MQGTKTQGRDRNVEKLIQNCKDAIKAREESEARAARVYQERLALAERTMELVVHPCLHELSDWLVGQGVKCELFEANEGANKGLCLRFYPPGFQLSAAAAPDILIQFRRDHLQFALTASAGRIALETEPPAVFLKLEEVNKDAIKHQVIKFLEIIFEAATKS